MQNEQNLTTNTPAGETGTKVFDKVRMDRLTRNGMASSGLGIVFLSLFIHSNGYQPL